MQSSVNSYHSYPKVFGIQFALEHDLVGKLDENHYNGCQDIDASYTNVTGQVANQQSTKDQIKELKNKLANKSDLEGIDIHIIIHGDEPNSGSIHFVSEKSIPYLKQMLEVVNNYLKDHKNTKAYIRLENCHGNPLVHTSDGSKKKEYNILEMASKYFDDNCKDRVYCRQIALPVAHMTHLSGKRRHFLCKGFKKKNDADRRKEVTGSTYPVQYNEKTGKFFTYFAQDADCFDYFPLSKYKNHSNEKYYGVQGKQEKNKFLQWTKWNGQNEEKPDIHGNYPSQQHKETTNYKKRSDIKYKDECWFKKGIKKIWKRIKNWCSNLCCGTKHANNIETQNNLNTGYDTIKK